MFCLVLCCSVLYYYVQYLLFYKPNTPYISLFILVAHASFLFWLCLWVEMNALQKYLAKNMANLELVRTTKSYI